MTSIVPPRHLSTTPAERPARPHIVIIGAGFGGINAAIGLARAPVDVTIIDRQNHHLFQPLLYQVATAGLSPAQIAIPIRRIFARYRNVTVLMETAQAIDPDARTVSTCTRSLPYDFLVIATGARHTYFGNVGWEHHAPGLKTIADATLIRARILSRFENAEVAVDPEVRARHLTFVVVGAGATGLEVAGSIAELARKALANDFRNIDPSKARIVLVEAGQRVLPAFPEKLSRLAQRQIERLGVEVRTGVTVSDCSADGVALSDGSRIDSGCIIWAAGAQASPAASWLNVEADRAGRIQVKSDLTVPGHPEIFAIGDTANVTDANGKTVPGVAPAAKQMGQHVARSIRNRLAAKSVSAFAYRDLGSLATIGRKAAVADFGRVSFTGFFAWLLWCFVHVLFLIGFRNRLAVMMDWAWAYFTYERGARLITHHRDG